MIQTFNLLCKGTAWVHIDGRHCHYEGDTIDGKPFGAGKASYHEG